MSRGKLVLIAVVACVLLALGWLWHDLRLPYALKGLAGRDIEVSDVAFERVVDGRAWKARAEWVARQGASILVRSVDLSVRASSDQQLEVWAASGDYVREQDKGSLFESTGNWVRSGDVPLYWHAPRADFDGSSGRWFFPRGLVLSRDENLRIEGNVGSMDADGTLTLSEGVKAFWNE